MTSLRPRITVGVPVYNGETLLRGCLESLAAQTSREIVFLIMDNASIDGTPAIAHDFAARDPRFRVLRQPRTVDVRQNFADVLAAADTEYFAWRAYDDRSAANWTEMLTALLDANPRASLAASRFVAIGRDGKEKEYRAGSPAVGPETPAEIRTRVMSMSPSWMYGLYRREEIQRVFARCRQIYGYIWSLDVLVVLTFILNRALVTTDATVFQGYETGRSQAYLQPNHYVDSWAIWSRFYRAALTILRESRLTPREQRALHLTMIRLTNQRSEKLRRIARGALGAWLLGRDGRVRRGPLVRVAASQ